MSEQSSGGEIRRAADHGGLWVSVALMAVVIVTSNLLVAIPINDWLVWGALTYPFAFLITDVVNRLYGASRARRVVYVGFATGVFLSVVMPDVQLRIAIASGMAFLIAQLLDIWIFARLRHRRWFVAPGVSSAISTVVDTLLFFGLAFWASGLPWWQWAVGDLGVKWCVALLALVPYRLITRWVSLAGVHRRGSGSRDAPAVDLSGS